MKKLNNKGFSLVELIIVIAIMVILVAVIAPQYTKFVNNSKISNDVQTASDMATAIDVLIAEGTDATTLATDVTNYQTNTLSKLNNATGGWTITYDPVKGVSKIELLYSGDSTKYVCYPNPDDATNGINAKLKK